MTGSVEEIRASEREICTAIRERLLEGSQAALENMEGEDRKTAFVFLRALHLDLEPDLLQAHPDFTLLWDADPSMADAVLRATLVTGIDVACRWPDDHFNCWLNYPGKAGHFVRLLRTNLQQTLINQGILNQDQQGA